MNLLEQVTSLTPGALDQVSDAELIEEAGKLAARIDRHRRMLDVDIAERDLLVLRLRQVGFGYDRIASALSVSKPRAQQIVKEAAERVEWPTKKTAAAAAVLRGEACPSEVYMGIQARQR